ncbi:uncharacterized protein [Nicotiana tomentosiformis]|uniref:uncharacterized protein n=1 Tax=Nicotiana tomentosiformis TaxID=4098 RepID=UPI00388C4BF1
MSAENEEQRAYQFLMGLNDTYVQTRSNILMMKPLPSVGTMYNILLFDEKQRNVSVGTQFPSTSASFSAGISKQGYSSTVNFDPSKPNVTCKYCKKPGHTIDKCYKCHGFPPNFKFTISPNFRKTAAHVELTSPAESGIGDISTEHGTVPQFEEMYVIPGLTKDQYSQLMMLLQQSHLSPSPSASNLMGSVNFAGELIPPGVSYGACMLTKVDGIVWIIDSGAFDHMTSTRNLLFNGPPVRKTVVLGKLDNGLYKLFQSVIAPSPQFSSFVHFVVSNVSCSNSVVHASVTDECSSVDTMSAIDNMNKAEVVCHYRLRHIPFSKLKTISAINFKFPLKQSFSCPICPLARQTRFFFPESSIQSTHPF